MDAPAPLIRECPKCGTRFRVAPDLLDVADGQVRCGACLTVFDGRAEAVRPAVEAATASARTPEPGPTAGLQVGDLATASTRAPEPDPLLELGAPAPELGAPAPEAAQPARPQPPPEPAPIDLRLPAPLSGGRVPFSAVEEEPRPAERTLPPTEAQPKTPPSPQARMGARAALVASALPKITPPARPSTPPRESGVALTPDRVGRGEGSRSERRQGAALPFFGVLALLATLVFLVFGLGFDAWSLRPELRRAYEVACDLIGCRVPSPNAPTAWAFHTQAVRRPGPPEPITVEAELINNAPYRQALPTVAVRFTSASDELVAEERLTPSDYQADRPRQKMTPGKPKVLRLRFPDPGAEATQYQISLL